MSLSLQFSSSTGSFGAMGAAIGLHALPSTTPRALHVLMLPQKKQPGHDSSKQEAAPPTRLDDGGGQQLPLDWPRYQPLTPLLLRFASGPTASGRPVALPRDNLQIDTSWTEPTPIKDEDNEGGGEEEKEGGGRSMELDDALRPEHEEEEQGPAWEWVGGAEGGSEVLLRRPALVLADNLTKTKTFKVSQQAGRETGRARR